MSWELCKLETLASDEPYSLVGGPFGSKLTSRDYVDNGVPVIRGSNLNNGRFISMEDFVFVSDAKVRKDLQGNLAKSGDLVFTQRGTLGQVALIPEGGISEYFVVSQSQMKMTVDESKADKLFLYYYFSSHAAIQKIMSFTSSSGVPHINLTVLRNFEVPHPPIHTQKAIVDTLSTYDDLIENNRRRIQLLEESARLLYREWFVHLRFPGHEHVKAVDDVPEGWSIARLTSLANVVDGTHDSPKPTSEGYYMVTGKHITNGFIDFSKCYCISSEDHRQVMRRSQPEKGDVIFSNIGTLGSAVLVDQDFEFSIKNVALFKPLKSVYSIYLYTFFSDPRTLNILQSKSSGTSQKFFSLKFLRSIEVLIPPSIILEYFHDVAYPLFAQRSLLYREILKLQNARDLLLPRLMNGEISV